MVKFVASDLDGTLLPPDKIMPERTFDDIEKLYEKGVVFAPASGRQLPNLKELFRPVLDKIAIIAENGGIAWYRGQTVFTDPTPADGVLYALDIIREVGGLYPLLSCTDCAYYDSDYPPFVTTVLKSYSSTKKVSDLKEIVNDVTVLKISVWDEKPCAIHGGLILPQKIEGLRAMISGYDWLDVSAPQANKGRALKALLEKLGIAREECIAFGDHMNDLEMLQAAGKAYVPANAYPLLKEQIGEIIPSNADFGVIQKLEELL